MEAQQYKFTDDEVNKLMDRFLKSFVDIPKILKTLDSDLTDKFKKRNGIAFQQLHEKGMVDHDHEHEDMCDQMHSTIFISPDDQNSVEKLIAKEIYPPRFKINLKDILKEAYDAYNKILALIKQKSEAGEGPENFMPTLPGMEKPKALNFDEEECKQIMKKITYESVNRFIRTNVKKEILAQEKSYAQQPMLLAFPSGAPKEADLAQIISENMQQLMESGYTVQKGFLNLEQCEL